MTTHLVSVDGNLVGEDCGLVSRSIAAQSPERFAEEGFTRLLTELRTSGRGDFEAWAQWCGQAVPDAVHTAARSLVAWSDRGVLLRRFNQLASKDSCLHVVDFRPDSAGKFCQTAATSLR